MNVLFLWVNRLGSMDRTWGLELYDLLPLWAITTFLILFIGFFFLSNEMGRKEMENDP